MGLWSIKIKQIVILGQTKVESNGVLAKNPTGGHRQWRKASKEAGLRSSYGCNIYQMLQMFSNYQSATLSHSPFASGPDSPSPQKSKTAIYNKFCHARWNEYLSDFFLLKLLFLWESSIWPQTAHLIEKNPLIIALIFIVVHSSRLGQGSRLCMWNAARLQREAVGTGYWRRWEVPGHCSPEPCWEIASGLVIKE